MYRQLQLLVAAQQNTYTGTAFNLSKGKAILKRSLCVCVCVCVCVFFFPPNFLLDQTLIHVILIFIFWN